MTRALLSLALALGMAACTNAVQEPVNGDPGSGGDGSPGSGGREVSGQGGRQAGRGGDAGNAGNGGTAEGGGGAPATGGSGAGGSVGGGGSSAEGGAGEAGSGAGGASVDAPVADGPAPTSADGGASNPDALGDEYPGKPVVRLCKKEWTHEQCCAFLCNCLSTICADSAKGKPGIATCPDWCPKLSNMAMRCHVYHCYISISPTGGIKDHDSHCGHAANQVGGGDCPALVYQ